MDAQHVVVCLLGAFALATLPHCSVPGHALADDGSRRTESRSDSDMSSEGSQRDKGGADSKESTDGAAPVGMEAAEAACKVDAISFCSKEKQCAPHAFATSYVDDAACQIAKASRCLSRLARTGTSLTVARVTACQTERSSLACDDWEAQRFPNSCFASPGAVAAGSSCLSSWECATGLCSLANVDSHGCGTCKEKVPEGGSCKSNGDCAVGLRCGGSGTCLSPRPAGQSCSDDRQCALNAVCTKSTCRARLATYGSRCGASYGDCDFWGAGLACNYMTSRCTTSPIRKLGESCGWNGTTGDWMSCGPGTYCSGLKNGEDGTCSALGAPGASCTSSNTCQEELHCSSGQCTALGPAACK
jgi:hypothetical protein